MEIDSLLFGCEYMTQGKRTLTSWMSPHEMTIALRLQECMHLSRFELICFRPEAVHTDDCRGLQECSFLWDISWALGVVPRIAHKTYNPVDLFLFIKDIKVDVIVLVVCDYHYNDLFNFYYS